jgi:hypothetical protein
MSDQHVTAEELAEESRKLKRLIEEAQRIDREITAHLLKMRQLGRPSPPNQKP